MFLNRNAYAKFRLLIFSRHKIAMQLTNAWLSVWWIVVVFSSNYVSYCLEWGGVTPHDPSPRVWSCKHTKWQRKLWVFVCKFQNRALTTVAIVGSKIQKNLIEYLRKTGLAHMGSMNCLLYRDIPCLCCYNPQFLPEILLVGFRQMSCALFRCSFYQFSYIFSLLEIQGSNVLLASEVTSFKSQSIANLTLIWGLCLA